MYIKTSDTSYINLNTASGTSIAAGSGGHSGDYAVKVGSTDVAFFDTEQQAIDALAEMMALVGTVHVEGNV